MSDWFHDPVFCRSIVALGKYQTWNPVQKNETERNKKYIYILYTIFGPINTGNFWYSFCCHDMLWHDISNKQSSFHTRDATPNRFRRWRLFTEGVVNVHAQLDPVYIWKNSVKMEVSLGTYQKTDKMFCLLNTPKKSKNTMIRGDRTRFSSFFAICLNRSQ